MPVLFALALVGAFMLLRAARQRRPENWLAVLWAGAVVGAGGVATIGYVAHRYMDDFFPAICCHCPLAAVGVITGIAGIPAATRIIGDHVINKVLIARVPKLMCLTRLKEKCVARSNLGGPVLVAHAATARQDQVELRFSRMRVIGTKEFAFGNSH